MPRGSEIFRVSRALSVLLLQERALLGNKILLFSLRSQSVLCQGSKDVGLDQARGTPAFFTLLLLWDFSHCLCQTG